MPLDNMDEIKALIDKQGEAFEAFKQTHEDLKKADVVTEEKMSKIEKSLDSFIEAKTKIEASIEAEKKEREDLELRMSRSGRDAKDEKKAADVEAFGLVLRSLAADRGKAAPAFEEAAFDSYHAAQVKWLREGKDGLDAEEVKAMSVGSDPDGGYFVTPDVTGRIVKKVYETSPMRQICSVQPISSDKLEGIEDLAEAGAGYAGETATSGDTTTPNVGKWSIPVYWLDTEPKTTQQLLDDAAVDVEAWLAGKVADKLGRFENAEFVAGSTGKIRGITSYTTAADTGSGVTWGQLGHVVSGGSGAFASSNPADAIFSLMGLLKEAYLGNARFLTSRAVITLMRKFKDTTGQYLWQPSLAMGNPEMFAGYPITRAEDMPTLASGSLSLAFGDFSAGYQIVDRNGIRVLRDPYTNKPFVKFYTTKRTGGGVVNFEAIKLMKFATS